MISSHFLKLIVNIAFDLEYNSPPRVFKVDNVYGYGLGIKLLSPIGPIEFIYSRGDKAFIGTNKQQNVLYFMMGYKF